MDTFVADRHGRACGSCEAHQRDRRRWAERTLVIAGWESRSYAHVELTLGQDPQQDFRRTPVDSLVKLLGRQRLVAVGQKGAKHTLDNGCIGPDVVRLEAAAGAKAVPERILSGHLAGVWVDPVRIAYVLD
jgi:hypothetical protein